MAEAVAAFYAVETVVEGAAAGALAVSGSTVPLRARFQKILSPSEQLALTGSTANIVKNKIYLFGGQSFKSYGKDGVQVLSFAPDFGSSRTQEGEPLEVDYELQEPELSNSSSPLRAYTNQIDQKSFVARDGLHRTSWSRLQHSSVTIEDKIYVLGGFYTAPSGRRASNTSSIIPLDTILSYDTLEKSYTTLSTDLSKCTEDIPESRYAASCTSSPYPPPASVAQGHGPSLNSHGTIFLHGGYDLGGSVLHDTWTFDIETRAWHIFPSIVDSALQDKTVPGKIVYIEHKLWYVNGSTVMYLDLTEYDPDNGKATTLGTGRVGSGQWQVVYSPPESDPSAAPSDDGTAAENVSSTPQPPTSVVIPITTGAGRTYLLHLSPSNPLEMYIFQIPSAPKTAAAIKDAVRDKASEAIKNLPEGWKSGKHEWSRVEVIESDMHAGEIDRPDEELGGFAVAGWEDYGDRVVLWGGQDGGIITSNEGWLVILS